MKLAVACPSVCPTCGDRLIHLGQRGRHESSSLLGQFVHDSVNRQMSWSDIDGVAWRAPDNVLRIVEAKRPGQDVSQGQRTLLPLLARGVELLVSDSETRAVTGESGVFVLEADPYLAADGTMKCDGAVVRRVYSGLAINSGSWDKRTYECSESFSLDAEQLKQFLGGFCLAVLS